MLRVFLILSLCWVTWVASESTPAPYLVVDLPLELQEWRNFRNPAAVSSEDDVLGEVDGTGLDRLQSSGSGQISTHTLSEFLQRIPVPSTHLVVIDLREESHGFINGFPVSWTDGPMNAPNFKKTVDEIERDEEDRLEALLMQRVHLGARSDNAPLEVSVDSVATEREVIQKMGGAYFRIPVTDHLVPSPERVDAFLKTIAYLPQDRWIHIHCKAGKGRTTTFLVLLDIVKNGMHVSLNDILERQAKIGGVDLRNFSGKEGERLAAAQERLCFITMFYEYRRAHPALALSWSDWVESRASGIDLVCAE